MLYTGFNFKFPSVKEFKVGYFIAYVCSQIDDFVTIQRWDALSFSFITDPFAYYEYELARSPELCNPSYQSSSLGHFCGRRKSSIRTPSIQKRLKFGSSVTLFACTDYSLKVDGGVEVSAKLTLVYITVSQTGFLLQSLSPNNTIP